MKKLALLVFMGLIASCTQPELEITEENVSEPKIEIIQDSKTWEFPGDDELQAPYDPGVYGPETLTAGHKGVFSYIMYPLAQKQIPSERRGFRIYIRKLLCPSNTWELQEMLEVPYSSVTLVFPEDYCVYSLDNSTRWEIEYQVYDTKTGEDWVSSSREVKIFN
ncbi:MULTISPECIES: hypothetical protein [Aquimarina]|uniref:hypothetical protein n=1 Tax=Aquimarina TaxID=290174 RepID=UPI000D685E47|nr:MULTISPECIES: hypothetical protein [Aquimarina]